ncbi:MAG TPA: B12-binding domain-containing protein [Acidimicrobiales bacterium]
MSDETLSLTDAADRLGVHYMTAYRYVRTGRLPAVKQGAVWRVHARDVEALRAGRAGTASVGGPAAPGKGAGRRRRHDYHVRLEDRLLAGDEQGAWSIVEGALTAGVEPDRIYLDVLAPAMALVGDGWESGRVTVAQEHRASAVMLRLIGRLGPRFVRRGRKRGTVVIGAPEGDHHSVPVALAADLLRGAGFAVVDLGAHTPARSFVDAAKGADRLIGVGISATRGGNEAAIRKAIRTLHDEVGCPVVLGGRAVADLDRHRPLGADEITRSTPELLGVFGRLAAAQARSRARPPG